MEGEGSSIPTTTAIVVFANFSRFEFQLIALKIIIYHSWQQQQKCSPLAKLPNSGRQISSASFNFNFGNPGKRGKHRHVIQFSLFKVHIQTAWKYPSLLWLSRKWGWVDRGCEAGLSFTRTLIGATYDNRFIFIFYSLEYVGLSCIWKANRVF